MLQAPRFDCARRPAGPLRSNAPRGDRDNPVSRKFLFVPGGYRCAPRPSDRAAGGGEMIEMSFRV